MTDLITPVGRLVSGHPMELHAAIDNNGQPKIMRDGVTPQMNGSIGIAIAKNGATDWKTTDWGQSIVATATTAWPNGQHLSPQFAWKVLDGDSTIPNKKGNRPCDREGYPGHWILFTGGCFATPTYHAGRYQPHEVIQNNGEIKRGDYIRLCFNVTSNNSNDSPGMYVNAVMVELSRAGVAIISASAPDASAAFGGSAGQLPAGALIDNNVQASAPPPPPAHDLANPGTASAPPPPPPAHDLANPGTASAPPPPPPPPADPLLTFNGTSQTNAAWLAGGWTQSQIDANCTPA
ncbi:MAG: hypothetical protein KAR42_11120 [candidate division Zixibacteria bacterium]|nr:hypothetical protein [candidate division Zixibacteria bacterium]